jgi:hypothetical protein
MRPSAAIFGIVTLALPAQALAAPLATGGGFELPLLRLVLGFLFCVMVAVLAAIALKRGMINLPANVKTFALFAPRPREIQVREARRVSTHAEVCAITWRGRDYLFVVGPSGAVTVLETRESASEPPP